MWKLNVGGSSSWELPRVGLGRVIQDYNGEQIRNSSSPLHGSYSIEVVDMAVCGL